METPAPGPDTAISEDRFVAEWLESHLSASAAILMKLGIAFQLASIGLDRIIIETPEIRDRLLGFHVGFLIFAAVFVPMTRRRPHWLRYATTPSHVVLVTCMGLLFHNDVWSYPPYHANTMKSWVGFVFASCLGIIWAPYRSSLVPALSAFFYSAAAVSILWGREQAMEIGTVCVMILAICVGIHRHVIRKALTEGHLTFKVRLAGEAAASARFDHELQLASEIQDSVQPPETVERGPWKLRSYLLKQDQIGGDWAAIHQRADGSIVCAVVDAAGKGIQAALVVHAVQSVWVEHVNGATFDVDDWIRRINDVLLGLGERKPHAVTVGIVRVCGNELEYWSAGHLPLYVIKPTTGTEASAATTLGRGGTMLGVSGELIVSKSSLRMKTGERTQLLLVSDGVCNLIARGVRVRMTRLAGELESRGVDALRDIDIADDKTVVQLDWTG